MPGAADPVRHSDTQWIELDPETAHQGFADAVRSGLSATQKRLPSQFFYDEEGSKLFEAICDLPEYYLTRAEAEILETHAQQLAGDLPGIRALVELGSGSAVKTEALLRAFGRETDDLVYAPIDVSRSALEESVDRLQRAHPALSIRPAVAHYEAGLAALADLDLGPALILWLGSSIGNLTKREAARFLAEIARTMDANDRLLVGIDLRKDRATLEAAYDDAAGVTARFDLNLLARINRELGGEFALDRFEHVVHYDEQSGAVRSFLESRGDQVVPIQALDLEVGFADGERIHTEDSHKYGLDEIEALAGQAGLALAWRALDRAERFSLNLFSTTADAA